jgi:hypothetical protein
MYFRKLFSIGALSVLLVIVGCDPIVNYHARITASDGHPLVDVTAACRRAGDRTWLDDTNELGCVTGGHITKKLICEFTKDGYQPAKIVAKNRKGMNHYYIITLRRVDEHGSSEVTVVSESELDCPSYR